MLKQRAEFHQSEFIKMRCQQPNSYIPQKENKLCTQLICTQTSSAKLDMNNYEKYCVQDYEDIIKK